MSAVLRMEVVAAASVKTFLRMIEDYKGPPVGLRAHLVRELRRMDAKGNAILADIIDEIL